MIIPATPIPYVSQMIFAVAPNRKNLASHSRASGAEPWRRRRHQEQCADAMSIEKETAEAQGGAPVRER